MAATGQTDVVRAEVTRTTASVSTVVDGEVKTWAYRDGTIRQVASELGYSNQVAFPLAGFDLSNVGELFRLAAAVSGSSKDQQLQVSDYSGGNVIMTVTTVPETRTVFFEPDGTLLPSLDYGTRLGIQQGLADVVAASTAAVAVGVSSTTGAYLDQATNTRVVARRQRGARVPTTTTERTDGSASYPAFEPHLVSVDAIWLVLERERANGRYAYGTAWSVQVDDRDASGSPLMHFTVGGTSFVTDLKGTVLVR